MCWRAAEQWEQATQGQAFAGWALKRVEGGAALKQDALGAAQSGREFEETAREQAEEQRRFAFPKQYSEWL